jgi:hypothetical protein
VDLPTTVSLSSAVVIFIKNAYSEELLDTRILYSVLNIEYYYWIAGTRNEAPSE